MVGFDAMFETASVDESFIGVSVAVKPDDAMRIKPQSTSLKTLGKVSKTGPVDGSGVQPVVILKLQLLHYALVEVPQLAVHC